MVQYDLYFERVEYRAEGVGVSLVSIIQNDIMLEHATTTPGYTNVYEIMILTPN